MQFYDPLYRAEIELFAEADMHRAGLLLQGRYNLNDVEREHFRIWWEARPGKIRVTRETGDIRDMGDMGKTKKMDNGKEDDIRDTGDKNENEDDDIGAANREE